MIRRAAGGYSLYELIITIGVVALVMSLGVPSFGRILADHRLRVEVDAMFHAVHLARKESVMRRRAVTLCPSRDGQHCKPGFDWSQGWIMFANHDGDSPPQIDAGEPLLQVHTVAENVVISSNRHGFTLRATHKRATNGTIVVCDVAGRVTPRALVISYTGRPRVTLEDRRGKPYRCDD